MNTSARPTDIPAFKIPDENRRVLLARRPHGIPQPEDFAIETAPRPSPGPGTFLIRNIYLSADPAQRGWASAEANYSEPVPIGGPMRGLTVGVVVDSADPEVGVGEFLYGLFDWQDFAVADRSKILMRLRKPLPLQVCANLLGINGLTAYLALTELGRPQSGETLLVSTAAGAVGGFVGQIGRLLGCRTIGLTGDDAKVERCRTRYRYTEAFNYKTADLNAVLTDVAPQGINIYFDNTGGPILDTALRHMARSGRVVQCGTASTASWNPMPTGPRNEREVLTRRLVWSGFIVFDYLSRFEQAADRLAEWYLDGKIVSDEDVSDGIEHAPSAIASLYAGKNFGKKLIYIG
jgi:NADPH-dependent curcumin reductase